MSVVFDPFTGQIIDTGSSGGAPSIGGPVLGADPNAILITDGATNLSDVQLADGEILIGKTGDAPLATTITGTPNQVDVTNGPNTITLSTPQDIDSTASPTFANLNLGQDVFGSLQTIIDISSNVGSADTLNIGITNSDIINIGNANTQVNIYGSTVYQDVTQLNVTDKNITVNVGGASGSSFNAGIHVEELVEVGPIPILEPTVVGYAQVNPLRDGWNFKAPLGSGIANIIPGNTGFTIDQGSHNPITIATPANGLAIDDPYNQELSIALADSSTTGALSSTDFNTFNNKQDRIISKVKAYDLVSPVLPVSAPITVDGHSIATGDAILFGALSAGNNKIYTATVSGAIITWAEDTNFVPNINDYVAVEYGNSFAQRLGVFDGTSFKFNETVRYFNGNDYFEQSALYTTNIDPSTTATVFSLNVANSENIIMDYSIVRGSNKTTGTLYITANSGAVEISDVGVDLNSVPSGVSFSGSVSMGVLTLSYISDVSGSGFLKYNIRRWSDFAGGPGGPPSYSGGAGGTASIAIEQVSAVDPTIPFSNINTIQFDHDTGFNVSSVSSGVVKVSLGSTFKTWDINNGSGPVAGLEAVGEDTMTFVAGANITFSADNTLGAKTLTINSTGGGPSAQTVTLSNNITNGNVTGFVVDPLTADSFSADIVIKRDVYTGLTLAPPVGYTFQPLKSLQLKDGSIIFYKNSGFALNAICKINPDGTLNSAFSGNLAINGGFGYGNINAVIDVTEDPTNQVLAVFGLFTSYQGLTRNNVCFIDGDGNDIPDLYDEFGISSGGSGFNGEVSQASKIKYISNITGSTSPFGYLITGFFTELNGIILPGFGINHLVVSNQKGAGYDYVPNSYNPSEIRLFNKNKTTCSFNYGTTTLPSVSWPDCSSHYYFSGGAEVAYYDFINMPVTVIQTAGPFGGQILDLDTNNDGSVIFCCGAFSLIQTTANTRNSAGLSMIDVVAPGFTSVNFNWSVINPLGAFSPAVGVKVIVNDTYAIVGGNINNTICNNYLIYNYDATVNTGLLTPYGSGFTNGLSTFTENSFLNQFLELYVLSGLIPNTYMTTIYGCYDDSLASLVVQGYTKTAGIYPMVSFTIDSSGQLKYTSSNIPSSGNFTMKYKLTTV